MCPQWRFSKMCMRSSEKFLKSALAGNNFGYIRGVFLSVHFSFHLENCLLTPTRQFLPFNNEVKTMAASHTAPFVTASVAFQALWAHNGSFHWLKLSCVPCRKTLLASHVSAEKLHLTTLFNSNCDGTVLFSTVLSHSFPLSLRNLHLTWASFPNTN